MTDSPKVAVIIPTFDSGGLLRRAIRSVTAQTLQDWELVVIDDGSPEDVTWVADIDPRIRLLVQPNRGVSVARNVGVSATSAAHIAFLDQDDEWAPDKLERQYSDMVFAKAAFGHTGFSWVWSDRELDASTGGPATYAGLLGDQYICLSTIMVGRDLFQAAGGFDPLLRIQQDFDFDLRAVLIDGRTSFTPGALVRYHVHEANVSADYELMRREAVRIFSDHERQAERQADSALLAVLRQARAANSALAGAKAMQAFRVDRRPVHLFRALRRDPGRSLRGFLPAARTRLVKALSRIG